MYKEIFREFRNAIKAHKEQGLTFIVSWIIFICLTLFPGMYLRRLSKQINKIWIIDMYVLVKVVCASLCLFLFLENYSFFLVIVMLFTIETVLYNLFFILSKDIYGNPHSAKRSLILGFVNYFEIVFTFACLYRISSSITIGDSPASSLSSIDYTFFSVGVNGMLGYGDYHIVSKIGKILSLIQSIVYAMFFILFISYNLSYFTSSTTVGTKNDS